MVKTHPDAAWSGNEPPFETEPGHQTRLFYYTLFLFYIKQSRLVQMIRKPNRNWSSFFKVSGIKEFGIWTSTEVDWAPLKSAQNLLVHFPCPLLGEVSPNVIKMSKRFSVSLTFLCSLMEQRPALILLSSHFCSINGLFQLYIQSLGLTIIRDLQQYNYSINWLT
jgi:hypothetical protein